MPSSKQNQFVQEYLYIEEFPLDIKNIEEKKKASEDINRGVLVISIFDDDQEN